MPSAPSQALWWPALPCRTASTPTVHKWRREGSSAPPALEGPAFVPVPLPPAACAPAPDIRIEVRRGTTSVSVTWPLEAADQCAVWMRELLK